MSTISELHSRLELSEAEAARTQEWLDRFQGDLAAKEIELLEARTENERLRAALEQIASHSMNESAVWKLAIEALSDKLEDQVDQYDFGPRLALIDKHNDKYRECPVLE